MPLNLYICPVCESEKKSFKQPQCCDADMQKQIGNPNAKFMEPRDPVAKKKGKSVLRNQTKILRERSRNHARDVEYHDLIQKNDKETAKQNKWINKNGEKRKKIDDL